MSHGRILLGPSKFGNLNNADLLMGVNQITTFCRKFWEDGKGARKVKKKEPLVENLQECMVRKLIFLLFPFIFHRLLRRRRNFLSPHQNFVLTKAPPAILLVPLNVASGLRAEYNKGVPQSKVDLCKNRRSCDTSTLQQKTFCFLPLKIWSKWSSERVVQGALNYKTLFFLYY